MQECIFCQIVAGKVAAERLYEDDQVLAFLDINPVNPGHSLVIPKAHTDQFQTVAEADYLQQMKVVRQLAQKIAAEFAPERVGLMVHGFEVPHAHVHVIPLQSPGDLGVSHKGQASPQELAATAKRLKLS